MPGIRVDAPMLLVVPALSRRKTSMGAVGSVTRIDRVPEEGPWRAEETHTLPKKAAPTFGRIMVSTFQHEGGSKAVREGCTCRYHHIMSFNCDSFHP